MLRCVKASFLAGLLVTVTACSPAVLMEKLPTGVGGLPADTPAAPADPYKYPAVHDMPPPRPDTPLTEEQQVKLEKDLKAARDRLEDQTEDDQTADQQDSAQAKGSAKGKSKTGK